MYSHQVSNLSTVKSTFSYGYSFNSHVEAYWIGTGKIKVEWMMFEYQATLGDYDLDCKIGYGRTRDEAIEELLIALDDGRR